MVRWHAADAYLCDGRTGEKPFSLGFGAPFEHNSIFIKRRLRLLVANPYGRGRAAAPRRSARSAVPPTEASHGRGCLLRRLARHKTGWNKAHSYRYLTITRLRLIAGGLEANLSWLAV